VPGDANQRTGIQAGPAQDDGFRGHGTSFHWPFSSLTTTRERSSEP
jgi:hypothetical protein